MFFSFFRLDVCPWDSTLELKVCVLNISLLLSLVAFILKLFDWMRSSLHFVLICFCFTYSEVNRLAMTFLNYVTYCEIDIHTLEVGFSNSS